MRLSSRLILAVMAPVVMGLAVIGVLGFSYQTTYSAQQDGTKVRQIRDSITNLNNYVYSYLLYPQDRPQQQFAAEYLSLTQLIAGIQTTDPDQKALLENVHQNSAAMNDLFLQLEALHSGTDQTGIDPLAQAAEARLQGNLLIKSRDADVNASLLKKSLDDQINMTQVRSLVLILIVVLLLTVPFTILLIRMRRHVTSSLTTLRAGTEAVGAGNLDYRMNLAVRDELGDLARSFDGMTEQLRTITVSKVELQEEVEERKKVEKALEEYAQELQIANKELEAFSYSVSHDLRAPLRAMDGFSKVLLEDYAGNLDQQGKQCLEHIRSGSQRMGRLIDDILSLSKVVRAEIKLEKVDISGLATTIAAELKRTDPGRKVDFVIRQGLEATGDINLLNVALQNLLGNAFKFTSARPDARIEFGIERRDGQSVYFVRDNGAGFDARYIDKLFKPFERLHSEKEFPGTGIGLVTVQRIIQRHGGAVWAEGQVNRGASFYFTLGRESKSNGGEDHTPGR
jgi:signal transduction histidine kinase